MTILMNLALFDENSSGCFLNISKFMLKGKLGSMLLCVLQELRMKKIKLILCAFYAVIRKYSLSHLATITQRKRTTSISCMHTSRSQIFLNILSKSSSYCLSCTSYSVLEGWISYSLLCLRADLFYLPSNIFFLCML